MRAQIAPTAVGHRRGRRDVACEVVQHVDPARIAFPAGGRNRRHAVRRRLCDACGVGQRDFQRRDGAMLRLGDRGEELQVATDRVLARERMQARGTQREHGVAIGQAHARDRSLRECFDLARLKNALNHTPLD